MVSARLRASDSLIGGGALKACGTPAAVDEPRSLPQAHPRAHLRAHGSPMSLASTRSARNEPESRAVPSGRPPPRLSCQFLARCTLRPSEFVIGLRRGRHCPIVAHPGTQQGIYVASG